MDPDLPEPEDLQPNREADEVVTLDLPDGSGVTLGDADADGRADWAEVRRSDGTVSTLLDRDASGTFETSLEDTDADARVDRASVDLDNDDVADVIQADEDRDGSAESITLVESGTTLRLDPATGLVTSIEEGLRDDVAAPEIDLPLTPIDVVGPQESSREPGEYVTTDPSRPTAEADAVHGDPGADLQWAMIQSENGFCVPVSVGMIVAEFTGEPLAESEVVEAAIDMNLLYGQPGSWIGMTTEGTVDLLDRFGVDSHVEYGTLDDLRSYLDDDRGIVLMVDADELWTDLDDDVQLTDARADHAVVITGIDDERSMITLNDPGQPEGAGWEISVAEFMDAWDDSNYEMVVTELGPEAGDIRGSLSAIRHPAGYVLLPVVVRDDQVRRMTRPMRDEDR
jgi:hypothetical protein